MRNKKKKQKRKTLCYYYFFVCVNRKTEDSVGIHTIYEFGYFISSLIYVFLSPSLELFSQSESFPFVAIFVRLCPRHELVAALCKLLLRFLVVLFCCVLFLFRSLLHSHLRRETGGSPNLYTHKHTIHLHTILFNAAIIIVIIIIYYFSSNRYEFP